MNRLSKFIICIAAAGACLVVCSCGKEQVRETKNVIMMVPDGVSTSALAVAEWYRRYMEDDMSYELTVCRHMCGLARPSMSNGAICCSAPAMSGMVTGVPQRQGNISVYPEADSLQDIMYVDPSRAGQPLATVAEAARLQKGKSVGLVFTCDFTHATPAACASHTVNRGDSRTIRYMMASNGLDVVLGGGAEYVDDRLREKLQEDNTTLIMKDVEAFRKHKDGKLWALFEDKYLTYDMDRDPDVTPSLAEMTEKAISLLSKNRKGFFLMVEGSLCDYAAHANDPLGVISELLAFDDAVKVAMDFAEKDGNTTVIVMPDHGNSGITLGDRNYENYTSKGLDSLFVNIKDYKMTATGLAGYLGHVSPADIPSEIKRLTGIDITQQEHERIIAAQNLSEEDYMKANLSFNLLSVLSDICVSRTHIGFVSSGHTGEHVFLAAYHPKGDLPHGVLSNTEICRYMCDALGLDESLDATTAKYYVRHTELLKGYDYEADLTLKGYPKLIVRKDGKEMVINGYFNTVTYDGKTYETSTPAVYIKNSDPAFYISTEILDILK